MKMELSLKCRCGEVRGKITDAGRSRDCRFICLCDDCQAFAHWLKTAPQILDQNGGTEILPVPPSKMKITQGHEKLAAMMLSPKGMIRWYAECCRTPIANVMASGSWPHAGMARVLIEENEEALENKVGPLQGRFQAKFGKGKLPPDAQQTMSLSILLKMGCFFLAGKIRGDHRPNPFFDENKKPIREPRILSPAEREALRSEG